MQKRLPKRKPKYRNRKVNVDGHTFDSQAEARYYQMLKLLQKSGEVTSFEMQKKYELLPKFKHPKTGKIVRSITYIPDFVVNYSDGREEVVDVKGMQTQVFRLKEKLFMHKYSIPLVLVKYNYSTRQFEEI